MTCRSVHVWEKVEITLSAHENYDNPYTDVSVWVDLVGPDFRKRVYGFWDGGSTFVVRLALPTAGSWTWKSGASRPDAGLCGERGCIEAVAWTDAELVENPCRRGMVRATENGRAMKYADGTPVFLLGDTWWSIPTFRFRWTDEAEGRPVGPGMGFKDMVQYRKSQGYNLLAMIAAFPNWANDGRPNHIWIDKETDFGVRAAWPQAGTGSAKDMHNEGGRPFFFPGSVPNYEDIVPDFDRINPIYFQYMDRKIDYLNEQGITAFIEVARRDVTGAWQAYYDWPESYARYVQYIFSRYQANNCILSPIHYDWVGMAPPARDFNEPISLVLERFGPPPFGTMLSANCSGSTLINFGQPEWLTMHQIGNWRDHDAHWLLTEIYQETDPPRPALNGEPYYAGLADNPGFPKYEGWPDDQRIGGTEFDDALCRSGMYGSLLSGGFAGHIYGANYLWGGDIEEASPLTMWDVLAWPSAGQMQYLRDFVLSEGARYRDLVPNAELIVPNKTSKTTGNEGWAYCARTAERDLFMLYCEVGAAQPRLRGAGVGASYAAQWFDPRTGTWTDAGTLMADQWGRIDLPALPSSDDWAMKLVLVERELAGDAA